MSAELKSKQIHATREQWLTAAANLLFTTFLEPHGYAMPEQWSVACGWPKGGKGHTIGQCWPSTCSEDAATTHMFISPELANPVRVLDVLLHEQIHACIGCDKKHGKEFKAAQKLCGLDGKATATYATEGSETFVKLQEIAALLGDYPHTALRAPKRVPGSGGGGWVRYRSENDPTYTLLISPKTVERHGIPKDPWDEPMVESDRRV